MKKILNILFFVIAISITNNSFSQNLNWENLKPENKHLLNINLGWDYGLVVGLGYGYQLNTKLPVVLNITYSGPMGENLIDDYKFEIGGQIRLLKYQDFAFTADMHGVFRRYENPMVSMLNFGSDVSGVIGYYKPGWFVAGEVGFDKAIVSHFNHSDIYKDYTYDDVKDGWYEPAAAGNFYYGLQTGFSVKQNDITLALGRVIAEDFKTTPLIPYYGRLGFNMKINDGNN